MELNDTYPQTDLILSTVVVGGWWLSRERAGMTLSEHHQVFSCEQKLLLGHLEGSSCAGKYYLCGLQIVSMLLCRQIKSFHTEWESMHWFYAANSKAKQQFQCAPSLTNCCYLKNCPSWGHCKASSVSNSTVQPSPLPQAEMHKSLFSCLFLQLMFNRRQNFKNLVLSSQS